MTADAPTPPPIEYLDYLRREVEIAQLFFWCNSRMKLWLDCEWFVVSKRIIVGKGKPPQRDWRCDLGAFLLLRGRFFRMNSLLSLKSREWVWNPEAN